MMNPDPPLSTDWQKRYEEQDTPWDKGAPHPALIRFLRDEGITGRVLVPGCGRGHEVRAVAEGANCSAVGLDLSEQAVAEAKEQVMQTGPGSSMEFITGDFFALSEKMRGSFDWLVEHTCFCAIEPRRRADYVQAASSALRIGGRIFAIFYLNPDSESGPPFAVSKEELSALFDPCFSLVKEWVPEESFPGREDRELVRLLQRWAG